MPAHRAYSFLYTQCVRGMPDDVRLEIDAILGDTTADATLQEQRREALEAMDVDFG